MHREATLTQEPSVTCGTVHCSSLLASRFHPLLDAFVPLLVSSAEGHTHTPHTHTHTTDRPTPPTPPTQTPHTQAAHTTHTPHAHTQTPHTDRHIHTHTQTNPHYTLPVSAHVVMYARCLHACMWTMCWGRGCLQQCSFSPFCVLQPLPLHAG